MLHQCIFMTGLLFAADAAAQFNLYPSIDPSSLAGSLNISVACLTALNDTVNCDQTLFQMVGNVDAYFWNDDNATTLCTSDCMASATGWWSFIVDECANDQLNSYGKLYPADTVPGRFIDGMNIVCLTADTDLTSDVGVNGTIFTTSTVNQYDSTYTAAYLDPSVLATQDPVPFPSLVPRQDSDPQPASKFCLIQSYDWTGSDVIRPDCNDPANLDASQCIDPTDVPPENSRIANLYQDDLLCSQCFLKMFYLRVASPYLPDLDESDFLVEQWFDILDVCSASNPNMPDLIVRELPFYQSAPGTSGSWADNTTDSLSTPQPLSGNQTYNNTCTGRTIVFADLGGPPLGFETQPPCQVMPTFLNASTGAVQQMMGDMNCLPTFNTTEIPAVCAPLSCTVQQMPANSTCDDYARSISSDDDTITTLQLLTWNPNLIGLCSNTTEQFVCTSAPGGNYISPPALNLTVNEGSQQRGGGDGSGTSTGTGSSNGAARNSTKIVPGDPIPSPIQSGVDPSCTQFGVAQSGDGCSSFSLLFDITLQVLYQWNPVLGSNGEDCTTQFLAGYYYCVDVQGTSTTTAPPTPSPTASAIPSPIQSGIDAQCTTYAEAVSGDDCLKFSTENGITFDELYAWNPVLGQAGENCDSAFFADYYYCVGAPTNPLIPSPTQSGIVPNCNSYAEANPGDGCYSFAQNNGITTDSLYQWNTILGEDGSDCGTQLLSGYYYCIGVSS